MKECSSTQKNLNANGNGEINHQEIIALGGSIRWLKVSHEGFKEKDGTQTYPFIDGSITHARTYGIRWQAGKPIKRDLNEDGTLPEGFKIAIDLV